MGTQRSIAAALCVVALGGSARGERWQDATAQTIGATGEWSNKVELADVNGDGRVDILFANGGNYSSAGTNVPNRVFLNNGPGQAFTEATTQVFGAGGAITRVIKVRDVDGDGDADIVVGTTFQTQSRLYLGEGGAYLEVTATHLPAQLASVGDLELGDVDGDGDLDMVLADWGPGNPLTNAGGRTMLWINDGSGRFSDATAARMPDVAVRFSWELELVDVDDDYDLDLAISCKTCTGSLLHRNDGAGMFAHDPTAMPQFSNNYEFEAMDLNADDNLDLVTINDGPSLREHVFFGDATGHFTDATAAQWPTGANVGDDDNMVVFLDVDSDGDADFLIGSLSGNDRLLINDGSGGLTMDDTVLSPDDTPGTLAIQVADLDGDHKLDVVQAQGEAATPDRVYLGVDIAPDTAAPSISRVEAVSADSEGDSVVVRARVHDRKSPVMPHDFSSVSLRVNGGDVPMVWYGEYLWRGSFSAQAGENRYQVCATDAAGNSSCSAEQEFEIEAPAGVGDAGPDGPDTERPPADSGGCGCLTSSGSAGAGGALALSAMIALAWFAALRRRRPSR